MQRIQSVTFDQQNAEKNKLLSEYTEFLQLLEPHISTRTLSVLAMPKLLKDSNQLGWYTKLEGQPALLKNITDESQLRDLKLTLESRLNDIDIVIKQLLVSTSLSTEQKNILSNWFPRLATHYNPIYIINNDPVVIYDFEQPLLLPTVINGAKLFSRWWHFALLALVLLGLLWLLWYLFCPQSKKLELIDDVPVIESVIEPEFIPKVEPEPEPIPQIEPQVPVVNNDPNCITKEEIIKNKHPSRMVLIFDNSASMYLTLAESNAEIERYQNTDFSYLTRQQIADYDKKMTRLPNRLSSSKKVAASSIDKIQSNVDIGLVILNKCPNADKTGFYSSSNRSVLKNKISKLEPLQYNSATPLYSGVQIASSMLDGVNQDDYILIISDGEDNCSDNNICTLALSISAQKPRLKINIIDIAGLHRIDCVANMTGGKVFIAQNHQQIIEQMNKAVKQMDISRPVCK
ncbi:hypothetical protein RHO14_01490 [Orbus wheelerorum]|uniref:hypothetical protein n=1 Tax=Orbus wheelerorum TaxID=3074111 RepID=UPI00370D9481